MKFPVMRSLAGKNRNNSVIKFEVGVSISCNPHQHTKITVIELLKLLKFLHDYMDRYIQTIFLA